MRKAPSLLELSDQLLRGEMTVEEHHPFMPLGRSEVVAPETLFVSSFGNAIAFATGTGLLLIDTGSPFTAPQIRDLVSSWNGERVTTIVYTHGHIDHVMGAPLYEDARVIAHEAVPARFDRYQLTAGYNAIINARQFGMPGLKWPTRYRYPDETYTGSSKIEMDGEVFELHHAKGETDDHTWIWARERKVLACGDFFIWASPNAGNPQKVQRYPREWAAALREMAALDAEVLLPGHGLPIVGPDRIATALTDTAQLLETLVEQTLELMNQGVPLEEVVTSVHLPEDLLTKPYLRPVYDDPEFVIRNIWRLYGGWYDGRPVSLKPATSSAVAAEIAELCGGASRLAERAHHLAETGELRLACHLIDVAAGAAPEDEFIIRAKASIYERRSAAEPSTMATGIYSWAAQNPKSGNPGHSSAANPE
jgi:glyoxylase-like metal-dependent hydrolase (beta-lactamase superfamily II)